MPSPANSEHMGQISSGFSSNVPGISASNSNRSGEEKFFNNPLTNDSRDSYACSQKVSPSINFAPTDIRKDYEARFTSQQASYSFGNRPNNYTPHSSVERVPSNSSSRSSQRNISAQFFPIPYYGPSSEIDYFSSCSSMGFPVNKNTPLDYSKATYSAMCGVQDDSLKPRFPKQARNSFINTGLGKVSHM